MGILVDPAWDGSEDAVVLNEGLLLVVEGCGVIGIEGTEVGELVGSWAEEGSAEGVAVVDEAVGLAVEALGVGARLGCGVGLPGVYVGPGDGAAEGSGLWSKEGSGLGYGDGSVVGSGLGSVDGSEISSDVASGVGAGIGVGVGASVGAGVGA